MKTKITNLVHNKFFRLLVCFFLGNYGIHRFLMKRWVSGAVMLALAIMGGGSITGLWGLIDLVLIATGRLTEKTNKQSLHNGTADDPIILG